MRKLIRAGLCLSVLILLGCFGPSRQWRWTHPDSGYADLNRPADIAFCEQETLDISTNGPFSVENSRPYGGWGDFIFELCMEERGWELVQLKAGPTEAGK